MLGSVTLPTTVNFQAAPELLNQLAAGQTVPVLLSQTGANGQYAILYQQTFERTSTWGYLGLGVLAVVTFFVGRRLG